ncbi:MAG: DUF349 domain-containing protein, partial [Pseudomonadales bacterium]|nr:DUF349 domain-containing protein [Pseudomonadales bacterium]
LQQEDKKAQPPQQAQAEKHTTQALQRSARQQEIQDWKAFVTLPKLEALCDAMEKLRDTALPLLEKAEAIRDLQAQWRSMKAPGTDEVQVFWQRFQQAGDQAWLPCAEYFEKEKQRRQFNLSQRQAICAALETFAAQQNWAQTDWKSVAKILEKSRKEFHDFYPVERHEEKSIRERFDSAFAAINDKLLEQQQANEARKQQLVDMASSVANMSDTQQATARFKQIQEQWKQIGITRHREEQQLWQALQQHGQNIFEKHRHQQNQLRDAQNEQLRSARAVCEQIAALSTLDDATLTQSSSEFDRLQNEFKAITGIPEKLLPGIKKQFATACDSYRQQLAGLATRQHQQQLFELARRAQLCAAVETTPDTSSLERINTEWQQLALPADWERAIQQRKQRAVAAAQDQQALDYAANEQQLRQLCIELEILLDLESPEEDRQHRREYQLQKLQQGLHAASGSSITEKREQLQVRWYGTGCASSSVHSALEARFTAAMAQHRSGKS